MSLLSYIAESNKLWIAKIELELKKIYVYDFYNLLDNLPNTKFLTFFLNDGMNRMNIINFEQIRF